jgi:ribonucleoside-diphosphate reductase alpha chain
MDDLVDENLSNHALNIQREVAQKFRNLGVGVMGIQDMLIKLGLTYGKPESIQALEYIMKTIIQSAIEASHSLAVQRGSFPEYSERKYKNHERLPGRYLQKTSRCSIQHKWYRYV